MLMINLNVSSSAGKNFRLKHIKSCNLGESVTHTCNVHDKQFQYKNKLNRHIRSHVNFKKFSLCDEIFRREDHRPKKHKKFGLLYMSLLYCHS